MSLWSNKYVVQFSSLLVTFICKPLTVILGVVDTHFARGEMRYALSYSDVPLTLARNVTYSENGSLQDVKDSWSTLHIYRHIVLISETMSFCLEDVSSLYVGKFNSGMKIGMHAEDEQGQIYRLTDITIEAIQLCRRTLICNNTLTRSILSFRLFLLTLAKCIH